MTDLKRFIELYESFGVKIRAKKYKDNSGYFIRIDADEHEKITGYSCFYTSIEFDCEGKFMKQGFYE